MTVTSRRRQLRLCCLAPPSGLCATAAVLVVSRRGSACFQETTAWASTLETSQLYTLIWAVFVFSVNGSFPISCFHFLTRSSYPAFSPSRSVSIHSSVVELTNQAIFGARTFLPFQALPLLL